MDKDKPDDSELIAIYQAILRGFYQLPADRLETIPMQEREQVARTGTLDFVNSRHAIKTTEGQLSSLLALNDT